MARRKTVKEVHVHGCSACHGRYEDTCDEPSNNRECGHCESASVLVLARRPHVCCFTNSRMARKDEVEKYLLSKGCQWFICTTCKRTFPYRNPKDLPDHTPACCQYCMRPVDDRLRQRFDLPDEPLMICVLCGRTERKEVSA